jgi:hypothetical protein
MAERRDQHRVEALHRGVVEIVGYVQHRTHGEINLVGADQCQTILAGDVVQLELHLRVRGAEGLHQRRQEIQDRGTTRGNVELARRQATQARAEIAFEAVQAIDQWPRQFVKGLALARQAQAPAEALEQGNAQFTLQRPQLQAHRRLAEEHGLRGA